MTKKFSLGSGFADSLLKGKTSLLKNKVDLKTAAAWYEGIALGSPISKKRLGETIETRFSTRRLIPLYLLVSLIFIILITRLVALQLIEGSIFLSQAQGNGVRIKTIHAPRGVIYDRNGLVLARNRPAFRVAWDLAKTKKEDRDQVVGELSRSLGLKEDEIRAKITDFDKNLASGGQTDPVTVKTDVDRDTILKIETRETDLPGVLTEALPVREYPSGEFIASVLGYTGEISQEELTKSGNSNYKAGDTIGKDGVESAFEERLKGQDGQELVKVDANGARLGTVYTSNPIVGNDVVLSIDMELQKRAYEALRKAVDSAGSPGGSIVATDPNNGEILALVSYPSFDNNLFAKGISTADFNKLNTDKRTPLLNRVISASYPPGSTFKIISAASGLESGKITAKTIFEDTGTVSLGPITFSNWYFSQYGRKEGSVDIIKALQRSNDTYFYLLGQTVGEKQIQDFASKFGLGQTLGINLPGEVPGLVPTDEWKRKVRGEPWYPGNTLNLAIGQGDLLTTPLQINAMTTVVANSGKLLTPTLLKNDSLQLIRKDFVKSDYLNLIKQGMEKVPQVGGTAWPFFTFNLPTAGKTGTAESGDKKPHAWYTAFAPAKDPQFNITVMLEKAGEGSSVASPVARELLNWWFFERVGKKAQEASASGEKIGD